MMVVPIRIEQDLCAGPHTVTVTDANGCNSTLCTVLSEPTPVLCAVSSSDVKCYGGANGMAAVAASGGTPPYTYLWSNGMTTANVGNLAIGNYTVTVTDANGCTTVCQAVVNQSTDLIFGQPIINDATCSDACDGSATVNVSGGIPPYAYLWSDGQTTQTATGLCQGTYAVTIVDSGGCAYVDTASIVIGAPTPIVLSITDTAEVCFIDTEDSTLLHGDFFYDQWDGIVVEGVAYGFGVDTVIVFDSDTSGSLDPDLEVGIGPLLIIPDNIIDFNNDGRVDNPNDNQFGGVMTFDFEECVNINSFKFVDQDQNNLPVVTAYDSTGAIITQVSVPNMGESSVQIIALNAACVSKLEINSPTSFGVADFDIDCNTIKGSCVNGSADLTPSGGTPGYTYLWSNGATTQDLTGVPCATYTVTVTDANGCTMTRSITIAPGTLVIDSVVTVDASGIGSNDGSATVYASGGAIPYVIQLEYCTGTNNANSNRIVTGLL